MELDAAGFEVTDTIDEGDDIPRRSSRLGRRLRRGGDRALLRLGVNHSF